MTLATVPLDKKIILFDGVCHLCNASVQFLLKRDHKDQFRFVALQSALGQELLHHLALSTTALDRIIVYEGADTYFEKSEAVLRLLVSLGGVYSMARILQLLPNWICNPVYDWVARNRYRWFGTHPVCRVPTAAEQSKFLS